MKKIIIGLFVFISFLVTGCSSGTNGSDSGIDIAACKGVEYLVGAASQMYDKADITFIGNLKEYTTTDSNTVLTFEVLEYQKGSHNNNTIKCVKSAVINNIRFFGGYSGSKLGLDTIISESKKIFVACKQIENEFCILDDFEALLIWNDTCLENMDVNSINTRKYKSELPQDVSYSDYFVNVKLDSYTYDNGIYHLNFSYIDGKTPFYCSNITWNFDYIFYNDENEFKRIDIGSVKDLNLLCDLCYDKEYVTSIIAYPIVLS